MNIVRHIPNTITCLNLLSGTGAVIHAFQDRFDIALGFIILAAVFDFLDGLAARVLHAYSDTGKELDSLSDVVSFGVAPSLILYNFLDGFTVGVKPWVCFIPLLIAAFSAVRLARFNVDTRQSENFIGLPVPASGLCAASAAAFADHYHTLANQLVANNYAMPALSLILSILMVCSLPMFSLKFKSLKWTVNTERYIFLCTTIPVSVTLLILGLHWTGIVFFIFAFYIIWNAAAALFRKLSDK
ncbi:MAG TPA: CDP-diacylglycerol--serine O-phosphatidyltransferase [Candidatus Coprenecus stercoravium]|uniref:CDP-diacylglycerol--serine O-phosphatidyltransferase n=1 Tax=Candidatus Coprenecus stercoravium TaxID=2840735 RepID=A0A9D2K8B4_9BACT|nr:CDP-diacylglycerol--serine O-phosphatidyltransferase [Candidatus Coprenecus stercoravium]